MCNVPRQVTWVLKEWKTKTDNMLDFKYEFTKYHQFDTYANRKHVTN